MAQQKGKKILDSLKSNESRKEIIKQLIIKNVKEEFGFRLPLTTEENYPSDKLFELVDCLVDMLAETISTSS